MVPRCAPRLYQLTLPGWANPPVLLFALQAAEEAKPLQWINCSKQCSPHGHPEPGSSNSSWKHCWKWHTLLSSAGSTLPNIQQSPSSGCAAPPSPEATTKRVAELSLACWARSGQGWGKRRWYPRHRHFSWAYSTARLREWEQAVGEGNKHIFSKVDENMKSSWSQHRVLRAHSSNTLITTQVLLYPGSGSALPLLQAVGQALIGVQAAIVLVQEKVIVLGQRIALWVVGRGSVWALVSWRWGSRGRFQEFLDWRVVENRCIARPGPLQWRGQEDLVTTSPQPRWKQSCARREKVNEWRKSKYLISCPAGKTNAAEDKSLKWVYSNRAPNWICSVTPFDLKNPPGFGRENCSPLNDLTCPFENHLFSSCIDSPSLTTHRKATAGLLLQASRVGKCIRLFSFDTHWQPCQHLWGNLHSVCSQSLTGDK